MATADNARVRVASGATENRVNGIPPNQQPSRPEASPDEKGAKREERFNGGAEDAAINPTDCRKKAQKSQKRGTLGSGSFAAFAPFCGPFFPRLDACGNPVLMPGLPRRSSCARTPYVP